MFFFRKFEQYPSSLIFIHPAPVLSYIDSKQINQINSTKFVNSGFRSVVVITSAPHAEGRQFKSGRNTLLISLNRVNQYKVLNRESMGFD